MIAKLTHLEKIFQTALQYHQQGQLAEAEKQYRTILSEDPNHIKSLHFLGVIAHQVGQNKIAVGLISKAIAINNTIPMFHNNIAEAYRALSRFDDATTHYTRAINLKFDYAEPHFGLAVLLRQQGKLNEAVAEYRQALALKPNYFEAHVNLGNLLATQGDLDGAVSHFQQAISLRPNLVEAYNNLAHALIDKGEFTAALKEIQSSLKIKETDYAKTLFVHCIQSVSFIPQGIDIREPLLKALTGPWGRPSHLSKFCANFLKRGSPIGDFVSRANEAWPMRLSAMDLFGPRGLSELGQDDLLIATLETAVVADISVERFLTMARSALLEVAENEPNQSPLNESAIRFLCALDEQCFINEYIFCFASQEYDRVQHLKKRLIEAFQSRTRVSELSLLAIAAYSSLSSLPVTELLSGQEWSPQVAAYVSRHIREQLNERELRSAIPRLTGIENEISIKVMKQYEENPYPRWMKSAPVGQKLTIDAYLRRLFPSSAFRNLNKSSNLQILVAGCGTGQNSIESAQRYVGAEVLAVDLSLSSLAYAERKTRELGLTNIKYAHADLLQLSSIGYSFDIIEAIGVLHHLADPLAGWRVLLSILRPGGFMRVGLYSKLARSDINIARRFVAQRNFQPTLNSIRHCREEIERFDNMTQIKNVTNFSDFYSTSSCRDLLFHVQEHQFTLPQIAKFLSENGLTFLGFDLSSRTVLNFKMRFPGRSLTDLDLWSAYESEEPSTFNAMYQFWVQKA
jgi:tetratricopeptide (TPR) repeat protein/2-polyprenyl-3-methyl-5-hydroxy-6-metoxy-1,4-benzoquinol methylase